MYWQDSTAEKRYVVPGDVVDVLFGIACRSLPVDHAWALSEAVRASLPWLDSEPGAGIHTIHVAESGNGWTRPERADEVLHPSRRTRLILRLPSSRVRDAESLCGLTLDVAGHALTVEQASVRPLSDLTTIFSRYVVTDDSVDERDFMARASEGLGALGIRPKKMLCGIEHRISTPQGPVQTRSLMLADLTVEESVRLQQRGLGPRRTLGCGLFLPHKGINEIAAARE